MRRVAACLIILAVAAALPCPVRACILCGQLKDRQTLREELKRAKLVIYGQTVQSRPGGNAAPGGGTTEMKVLRVVKPHPELGQRDKVTLDRYIPVLDPRSEERRVGKECR